MSREIELWEFIAERLKNGEGVVLLVVAESSGSSPGRAGYKMAVAENGDLIGSIGGGVMEVNLVEQARALLSEPPAVARGFATKLIEQEHRKNSDHPSGMICSGGQSVLIRMLDSRDLEQVDIALSDFERGADPWLTITEASFTILKAEAVSQNPPLPSFEKAEQLFTFEDRLGPKNELVIIGGGHCAFALSGMMAKMDFSIRIFDDRPKLNTLEKNKFANEITIIDRYDDIADHIDGGETTYVVVMTLGYKTDAVVIRQLLGKRFKYFGVLGSKAKMATLRRELKNEGHPQEQLNAIRTPIGIQINSHTPEEIAVSIAAEIISVKNA